ncbi:uncharacterized protein MELLADRAFT_93398 [Melampsora larici-populina 98AG31]|uniref:Enoyl reductase (ER) domain-containing protein n=1 Tax=Melampsora larici-populina (strain 98AG31 / pathotype 3-4-7) TaxID=747676 RepID=F4RA86_MELLP|nr:uncharacterized protein MELLADRAFT_93398 [Melampsora larici-populina 98AG31]EGG10434.1 hypothetical protein MELLADRAFT_93398 [Melampsora larici-populina 98AG31]
MSITGTRLTVFWVDEIKKGGVSQHADDLVMIERPETKEGEVQVKVLAFGLNRMDILQRQGLYPLPPEYPKSLGVEFSGIIEKSNSQDWKHGEHVFGLAYGGAYAEYISVDARMIVKKPESLSWEEAASIPENWLTSYQALIWIGQLKKGSKVLIHGGASGIGIAAIQLAKSIGVAEIFTTAGTEEKVNFLMSLGATQAMNYKEVDFSREIDSVTKGSGVDFILDLVGQSYWNSNIKSLSKDGKLVLLGLLSGGKIQTPVELGPILFKRLKIEGTTLRSRSIDYQCQEDPQSGYPQGI